MIVPWTHLPALRRHAHRSSGTTTRWPAGSTTCARHNPDLIWRTGIGYNYGDWLRSTPTPPKDVIATAYFAYSAACMAADGRVLGHDDDASRVRRRCRADHGRLHEAYVAADGRIAGDTQTGYVLALRFGLLPEELRAGGR